MKDDVISRRAAINAPVRMVSEGIEWIPVYHVEQLPSVQPKHGKWIDKSGGIDGAWNYCSVCGEQAIDLYDFCPNCGADMRGETE